MPGRGRPHRLPAALLALAVALGLAACGGAPPNPSGDPVAGARLIEADGVTPSCGRCHMLGEADFEGRIGPNLDARRPGYDAVLDAIREGPGLMPSYDDQLDDRQLHDIAAYISEAAAR